MNECSERGRKSPLLLQEMLDKNWYMLCWAAKWLGEKEIMSSALVDFEKSYKQNPENDKKSC